MSTVTSDTLDATRRLREAGFDEKQAESVVRVLSEAQSSLATKSDISLLREHTDGRFTLLQWMLAFNLAFTMAILWKVFG